LVKLVEDLSGTYKRGTYEEKSKILKSIQVKLIVNDDKSLYIKENPTLQALDFHSDLHDGRAKRCLDRTFYWKVVRNFSDITYQL
jgi:hypothetical protein